MTVAAPEFFVATGRQPLTYSLFKGVTSTKSCDEVYSTWSELVAKVKNPRIHKRREDQPLIKLARFGDRRNTKGSVRHNENVELVFGLEADYDAEEVAPDEAARRLQQAGIRAVIYTSASHTPAAPRWRALVPFAQPVIPEERAMYMSMLNGALGGILQPESWVLSQIFYLGAVQGAEYLAIEVEGQCIDLVALVDGLPEVPAGKAGGQSDKVLKAAAPRTGGDDLSRAITLSQVGDQEIEDVRSALQVLTLEAADYDAWIRMGLGLKSLEQAGRSEGKEMWFEFSALCPEQYNEDVAREKWDSFEPTSISYKTIIDLAQKRGWVNPRSAEAIAHIHAISGGATRVDRTDAGNVALLADLTKGDLRYVPERRVWLLWDGKRWVLDEHGVAAQRAALRVAEHYHQQALEMGKQAKAESLNDKERKRLDQVAESMKKWATQCRSKRSIDNMLALAKCDSRFTLSVLLLDKDPWLLGVENGVVDLRTGLLRDAAREDYVTRRATVAYDPDAQAPRWEKFTQEITGRPDARGGFTPRPGLVSYLHRGLGYGLTGTTGEQKMFMAIGEGSNGKNVLLDTLQEIMGDYCVTVPPEALMAARGDADAERPSPVAATLAGARLAISSESKDGQRLDVALVKRHTGGGYMTARFMRENSFRFEISHKLWLMTNHRPALDHLDDALRGRLHLIPFDMRWNRPGHPARNPALPDGDKNLLATLRAEAPGILAWLVRGAVAYYQRGLEPPTEVVQMTQAFFQEQDPLGRWLDTTKRCEAREGVAASELFNTFRSWCGEEGEAGGPQTQKAFSLALQQRGVQKLETKGANLYGLRIACPGDLA